MERQPRERGRLPLSHGHIRISNNHSQNSQNGQSSQNSQNSQSQGVITKSQGVITKSQGVITKLRKRSLSRSRILPWRNGSPAALPASGGSDPAPVDSRDESPPRIMSFAMRIKNQLRGTKAGQGLVSTPGTITANQAPADDAAASTGNPTSSCSTGSTGSSSDVRAHDPAGGAVARGRNARPTAANDDDSASILLDTSNGPLNNGSTKQADAPATTTSPSPDHVQPVSPLDSPIQAPATTMASPKFFVLEPPPPIVSHAPENRPVQLPPGRVIPANSPAHSHVPEPPPPVRPPETRALPRKSVPQKQQPSALAAAASNTMSLSSAVVITMGLKKLRRASSKRTSNNNNNGGTGAANTQKTTPRPMSKDVPPPPAAVKSTPSSTVTPFAAQQQTAAKKKAGPAAAISTVPPPPPPIHSHPPSHTPNWKIGGGKSAAVSPPQQQQQHSQRAQQPYMQEQHDQSYQYACSVAAELDSVRQQCIAQVSLLHQRDAQIASLSDTIDRLRVRVQDQFQQQYEAESKSKESNGLYAAASASLPDSQVRSRWMALRWQIRQCVETSLADILDTSSDSANAYSANGVAGVLLPGSRDVSPTRAAQLRRLSPDYTSLLQSRTGTVCLVEATVWTVLAQHVFGDARRSSPMCWAAPPWKSLVKVNDHLLCTRPANAAFHQWRAQTAVFVASTLARQNDSAAVAPYVDEVVRQLEVEVGALLALASGRSERTSTSSAALRRQLFGIVAEAIALDADLCQQRAWFYVHFPLSGSGKRYGMPLDTSEMEVVEQEEAMVAHGDGNGIGVGIGSKVSLVVRPALFKAGNSRGDAYDEVEPIERSVVCRAPAVSPQQSPQSSLSSRRQ